MLNQDNIYVILFSLPIYQMLFYTVQLVTFKKTSPAGRYFGFLMLTMTVFLILNAVYHLGYDRLFSKFYVFFTPVLLSVAPVYFLYILSLTREDHDVSRNQKLLLFIPPVLIMIINFFSYGMLSESARFAFVQNGLRSTAGGNVGLKVTEIFFWIGSVLFMAGQVALAGFRVRKILLAEANLMRQRPAYLAYLNWNWIMIISASVGVFLILNGLVDVIAPSGNLSVAVIYNLFMLICGGVAGYYGMKQNTLLVQVSKMTMPEQEKKILEETAANSENKNVDFIQKEEAERIRLDLIQLMEKDKPFLKADFSMGDLCDALSESRRKVTYVINDYMDKNFYGIVNDYRIKEAVDMLSHDKHNHLKIEVIAEMVGFQSKSSFNACFKKFTGQTPSAFKASVSNRKNSINKS